MRMLFEKNKLRVGIAALVQKGRKDFSISKLHPMSMLFMYLAVVQLEPTVISLKLFETIYVVACNLIAIVRAILSPNLNRETDIPDILEFYIVWVSCHHGCSCPSVCHHGGKMIDTVTSS